MRRLASRWGVFFASLIAVIVAAHFLFEHPVSDFFNQLFAADANQLVVAAMVILGLSVDILLPIPSSVISVWGGVSLGMTGGFLAVWLGLCIGCLFGYWLGAGSNAWLLGKFIRERDLLEAQRFSARYGAGALALLRAVPVLAETSVLAAGAVRMPIRLFLVVTGLSNAGVAFVYAYVGGYASAHASLAAALTASIAVPAIAWGTARLFARLWRARAAARAGNEGDIQPAFSSDFTYPVLFTRCVFAPENRTLIDTLGTHSGGAPAGTRVLFVADRGVIEADPQFETSVAAYCRRYGLDWGGELMELPGGEAAKTQDNVNLMHRWMLDRQLDRQSYVIAVGGGAVLDAAGYAAATFHRGIRIVRMPTTVLAQNDAGIGVKNGINAHGIKNLMGCFTVPHAVINDSRFLETLPARVFRAGFAEAVKVALIRDAAFFDWIEANAGRLTRREEPAARYLIKRCAELHLHQICRGGDPFETGNARPLDYGHWSAHKLESLSGHQLSHGEAVAIGMALDALYAVEVGLLSAAGAGRVIRLLQQLGFELWHPSLAAETDGGENALLTGLEEFRQHLGGKLCITLLTEIGRGMEVDSVDAATVLVARDKLFTCAEGKPRRDLPGGVDEIGSVA